MLLPLLLACNGQSDETPPDFNYIPTYDDVCLPSSFEAQDAARAVVDTHIEASEFIVASNMDLCHENSCSPCTTDSNPMLGAVRGFEDWGTYEAQALLAGVDGDVTLEDYFATALDYEWRYLLLSTPLSADGSTTMTLSQGIRLDGDVTDWDFQVAHESLDAECAVFNNTMAATKTPSEDGYGLTTTAGAEPFGFQVPLTEELPAPSSFDSVDELEAFVQSLPGVSAKLEDPTVELAWDEATGTGCATLTGYAAAATFSELTETGGLDAYADEAGHIKTTLSLDLARADVQTWSSK